MSCRLLSLVPAAASAVLLRFAALAAVVLLPACSTSRRTAASPAPNDDPPHPSASAKRFNPHAARPLELRELWVDLVRGDEAADDDVLSDLASAGVIYVGEYHAIPRHHEIQLWLLQEVFRRGVPLVLCMEQLEAGDQPAIDRYCAKEIDFATLAREIDWPTKWRDYAAYEPLCDFAQKHRIPIRGLNAPGEIVRAVNRGGGVAKLSAEQRARLPKEIVLDDPPYEKLANLELSVHASLEREKVRPMFEAQVARDEAMAAGIVAARRLRAGEPRTAFVVVGAGHVRFGLGTAARVRRRDPGISERIVLMSESGQLQLTAGDRAAKRDVTITHDDLREVNRPAADYLRVLPLAQTTLPPGHPPIER